MFKGNRNLYIIALIAVVNALGYGIIIPVLYSYSLRFGLTDFQNGLLFSVFSICQFLSTPIIGRLSDRYGRKPLLVGSIAGTAVSFFMLATAPNLWFLFIARALDGITAGNIPVASAVISDTLPPAERAKGFGIIGASFGFGFIFGPAISSFTVGYSPALPFIIAGVISVIAVVLTAIFLPETNKHMGQVKHSKLFDFKHMIHALTDQNVGLTLIITLVYSIAFSIMISVFQPFAVKILGMTATEISLQFTLFGIIGLITQILFIGKITQWFGLKPAVLYAFILFAVSFFGIGFTHTIWLFVILSILMGIANSSIQPLLQTILSQETDEKSQGSIQGLNASYMSIGQILGPILGGALATYSISYPYFVAGMFAAICAYLSTLVLKPGMKKDSVF